MKDNLIGNRVQEQGGTTSVLNDYLSDDVEFWFERGWTELFYHVDQLEAEHAGERVSCDR